jgi:DNA invertase Pin-like site-specific DNA recombinase
MTEHSKIAAGHQARLAVVYLRQSSASQVENNRESTERQYALAERARELGWPDERVLVIDEGLGLSGSGSVMRAGFARLTSEVALARVGIVLGLEVSRLARKQCRLAPADRVGGADRYADWRCRRPLPPGPVQR